MAVCSHSAFVWIVAVAVCVCVNECTSCSMWCLCAPTRLAKVLSRVQPSDSPAVRLARASCLLTVCSHAPEQGVRLVRVIQTLLADALPGVVALCLRALAALCREDCLDVYATMSVVRRVCDDLVNVTTHGTTAGEPRHRAVVSVALAELLATGACVFDFLADEHAEMAAEGGGDGGDLQGRAAGALDAARRRSTRLVAELWRLAAHPEPAVADAAFDALSQYPLDVVGMGGPSALPPGTPSADAAGAQDSAWRVCLAGVAHAGGWGVLGDWRRSGGSSASSSGGTRSGVLAASSSSSSATNAAADGGVTAAVRLARAAVAEESRGMRWSRKAGTAGASAAATPADLAAPHATMSLLPDGAELMSLYRAHAAVRPSTPVDPVLRSSLARAVALCYGGNSLASPAASSFQTTCVDVIADAGAPVAAPWHQQLVQWVSLATLGRRWACALLAGGAAPADALAGVAALLAPFMGGAGLVCAKFAAAVAGNGAGAGAGAGAGGGAASFSGGALAVPPAAAANAMLVLVGVVRELVDSPARDGEAVDVDVAVRHGVQCLADDLVAAVDGDEIGDVGVLASTCVAIGHVALALPSADTSRLQRASYVLWKRAVSSSGGDSTAAFASCIGLGVLSRALATPEMAAASVGSASLFAVPGDQTLAPVLALVEALKDAISGWAGGACTWIVGACIALGMAAASATSGGAPAASSTSTTALREAHEVALALAAGTDPRRRDLREAGLVAVVTCAVAACQAGAMTVPAVVSACELLACAAEEPTASGSTLVAVGLGLSVAIVRRQTQCCSRARAVFRAHQRLGRHQTHSP